MDVKDYGKDGVNFDQHTGERLSSKSMINNSI